MYIPKNGLRRKADTGDYYAFVLNSTHGEIMRNNDLSALMRDLGIDGGIERTTFFTADQLKEGGIDVPDKDASYTCSIVHMIHPRHSKVLKFHLRVKEIPIEDIRYESTWR